ncbi:MAG: phosphotransferase family protein [Mycobacteriales bacterium]
MTVEAQLLPYLQEQLGKDAAVKIEGPVRRSGGGSSKENYAFDASWLVDAHRDLHRLLVRREAAAGVVATAARTEFQLLRELAGTDIPAPTSRWFDDGTWFQRPAMVVDRAAGRASRAALRDADPLALGTAGQVQLARDLARVLVQVHSIPVPSALPDPGPHPAKAELDRWEGELDRVELAPQLELRLALRWLRDNLPDPVAPRLVHGDARPANLLVDDGRLSVLLDWELAHVGDPLDDLGWYTCSVYALEHTVAGHFTQDDFIATYELISGAAVDRHRLRFWQVLSALRLAVIALTGVRNFVDGTTDRPAAPPGRLLRTVLSDAVRSS